MAKIATVGVVLNDYTTIEQFKEAIHKLANELDEIEFKNIKKRAKKVRGELDGSSTNS